MIGLATPWLLCALPLPWLVRRFIKPAQQRQLAALKVPFYQRIATLQAEQHRHTALVTRYKYYLAYTVWALLVLAASGPEWIGAPVQMPQNGRNIMLVVDLSGSMQLPDYVLNDKPISRLAVVKSVAKQFIASRTGDRLGLVLFGAQAYLQTPLTFDRHTVEMMLDDASIGLAGDQTAIGDGVALAVKRLLQVPEKSRVIVLLTDGGNNAGVLNPMQAAQLAQQAGIKIYTIGIGAERLVVQSMFGPQVINPSSDLDQATLKKMSQMTRGTFFRAKDTQALEQAYETLNQVEPVAGDATTFRPTQMLYMWPLVLALLWSLVLVTLRLGREALTTPFRIKRVVTVKEVIHE